MRTCVRVPCVPCVLRRVTYAVLCMCACLARENALCLVAALQEKTLDSTDQRHAIAKEHAVKGAFAFFRDGCVFEFGGEGDITEEKVTGLLKQFGGTRGPKPEEEELAAAPKRPAWKRQSSVAVMKA